jgi:hypothetical protein
VGAPTIRSCLELLQSMFARAVEWDRTRVNVVKLIAKPRVRRARAIKPPRPIDVEALRRQMLCNPKHGLRDATLVSVLAYAGLRPEEAPLLDVLRADLHDYELAASAPDQHARQPACEAIGVATLTTTRIVKDGKRKTKRTYDGPVPYDLRHSFVKPAVLLASLTACESRRRARSRFRCRCGERSASSRAATSNSSSTSSRAPCSSTPPGPPTRSGACVAPARAR